MGIPNCADCKDRPYRTGSLFHVLLLQEIHCTCVLKMECAPLFVAHVIFLAVNV